MSVKPEDLETVGEFCNRAVPPYAENTIRRVLSQGTGPKSVKIGHGRLILKKEGTAWIKAKGREVRA